MFIAYTIKGFGLPFAGHKDNHAGLMNPTQIAALRDQFGIAEGGEWEPYGGLGDNAAASLQAFVERSPLGSLRRERSEEHTSELQSLMRISYAVFCLNKKNKKTRLTNTEH